MLIIRFFKIPAFLFCTFYFVQLNAQVTDFKKVNFDKADSIAALYPSHSLADLKLLSDKLTGPLQTDVEKFRAIYRWVCDNIENDYGFYKKNKYKRKKLHGHPEELEEWDRKFSPMVFKKLLREHKTVCTGYAYLVRELAYFADIPCEIIQGYGRTIEANIGGPGIANHSWNAVQIDDQWHLCDATWSSGAINTQEGKFIKHFNKEYFLAEPSLFVLNHYPSDTARIFLKDKPTLDEFLNSPLIYKNTYRYQVIPILPETFEIEAKKGDSVSFCFDTDSMPGPGKIKLQIVQGSYASTIDPEVQQEPEGNYTVNHIFKRRGDFVVHLLLNGDHVITYKVRVGSRMSED